ncbi:MAG: DNA polymerase IV [Oscillospiraceae bacterium]|nr:DNA polymerase IV [Oscillospiraceae bacterium]
MKDRIILHADVNSFFASCEEQINPKLKKIPMAVAGNEDLRHGIILAKNQMAKPFGIATGMVKWEARQRCRDIVFVRAHTDEYREFTRSVRKCMYNYTDLIEPFGGDEAWLDVTGNMRLKGDGYEIANRLREDVKRKTGLTISVGVSWNKAFSKLGSDFKKPDAVTVFDRRNYKDTVWRLPAGDLLFVGRATTRKLNSIGVHTIGELAETPLPVIQSNFGKNGVGLWAYANGHDGSEVCSYGNVVPPKSIGNSTTTPRDLCDDHDVKQTLFMLSDTVATRMREEGVRGQVVSIGVRGAKGLSWFSRQTKLKHATCISKRVASTAYELFLKCGYDWQQENIRSVGVRVSDLQYIDEFSQTDLFDIEETRYVEEALEFAKDKMRKKYGYECIRTGLEMWDGTLPVISPEDARLKGSGMYEITSQKRSG